MIFTLTLKDGETLVFDDLPTAGLFATIAATDVAERSMAFAPENAAVIAAERDSYIASVEAVLDDAELDNAGKLAALDAL